MNAPDHLEFKTCIIDVSALPDLLAPITVDARGFHCGSAITIAALIDGLEAKATAGGV
eukprot:SAG31_NODE_4319_length_3362_cov_2.182041_1_plen_57_part_10